MERTRTRRHMRLMQALLLSLLLPFLLHLLLPPLFFLRPSRLLLHVALMQATRIGFRRRWEIELDGRLVRRRVEAEGRRSHMQW